MAKIRKEKLCIFCSVFSRVKQEGSHAEEFTGLQGRIPELWTTGDVLAVQDLGKATISGSCHLNLIIKSYELFAPFFS
jgi:hypothetical protein